MKQDDLQVLVQDLARTFPLPETITTEDKLFEKLREHIDHLINHDFNKLVTLLYRIDVDENQLRQLLVPTDIPASTIITSLIIERQLKKIETRKLFKTNRHTSDDDRW